MSASIAAGSNLPSSRVGVDIKDPRLGWLGVIDAGSSADTVGPGSTPQADGTVVRCERSATWLPPRHLKGGGLRVSTGSIVDAAVLERRRRSRRTRCGQSVPALSGSRIAEPSCRYPPRSAHRHRSSAQRRQPGRDSRSGRQRGLGSSGGRGDRRRQRCRSPATCDRVCASDMGPGSGSVSVGDVDDREDGGGGSL